MPDETRTATGPCPQTVLDLIARFDLHAETYRRETWTETQIRREFLDPFFEMLGWDMNNRAGHGAHWRAACGKTDDVLSWRPIVGPSKAKTHDAAQNTVLALDCQLHGFAGSECPKDLLGGLRLRQDQARRSVLGRLRTLGYEAISDMTKADVVRINTCSVRDHAEQKVLSRLGALKKPKARRPDMVVDVIGCMAERDPDGIIAKMPHGRPGSWPTIYLPLTTMAEKEWLLKGAIGEGWLLALPHDPKIGGARVEGAIDRPAAVPIMEL